TRLPQDGVEGTGIGRVEGQGDGTGVLVLEEDALPGLAAVGGAVDAALLVGPVGMAEDGDEDAVRILRVDEQGSDLLPVAQAAVLPGLAAVGGAVDAVACG